MKVLVIDDEVEFTEALKRILERKGVEVDSAEKANEGVGKFLTMRPDVTILDFNLEDEKNGLDVLKEIRETSKDSKVILLTGSDDKTVKAEAEKLGISMFMSKPFDFVVFKERFMNE